MPETRTIILPVDDAPPPDRPLACGIESLHSARVGFVDNGLWHSMTAVIDGFSARARAAGSTIAGIRPFDHLAPDFAAQRAALGPFAEAVDVVVLGLGN
jgi:hypothetical protein